MTKHSPFDPLTSSTDHWGEFLLNPESHTYDYKNRQKDEYPVPTKLERVIQHVVEANLFEQDQQTIVDYAVTAALQNWDKLASFKVDVRAGGSHPFIVLPRIAHAIDGPAPGLVSCTHILWHRAPVAFDPKETGFIKLFCGFGKHVPMSNIEIEAVYLEQFESYKFIALEVLLRRGDIKRARKLFLAEVKNFPDTDPWCMDHLIYHGLHVKDAQVWLNQGLNGEPSHTQHSASALERWKKKAASRP